MTFYKFAFGKLLNAYNKYKSIGKNLTFAYNCKKFTLYTYSLIIVIHETVKIYFFYLEKNTSSIFFIFLRY